MSSHLALRKKALTTLQLHKLSNIFKSQDGITLSDILDLIGDQYYQFSLLAKVPFDASRIE